MKTFKTIFYFILSILFVKNTFAVDDIKSGIVNFPGHNSIVTVSSEGTDSINSLLSTIITYSFYFLALIVIADFIYIGFIFITAEGNEERTKKAWRMFTYAIVGLSVISLSWAIVKLVSTLSI